MLKKILYRPQIVIISFSDVRIRTGSVKANEVALSSKC